MPEFSLDIGNDFAALGPASLALRAFLAEAHAPDPAIFLADLVLEELVTNTIKYAYDDACAHAIHVRAAYQAGQLTLAVSDDGHAFNPLDQAIPDVTLPAAERDIGGLGIHLVRQMTDAVTYERRDGCNVVTATKDFDPGP